MTVDTNGDNGNGKVTLAVINTKLDRIFDWMREHESCQKDADRRLNGLENGQATRIERLRVLDEEVKALRQKADTWSFANSVGAILAGILGAIGISR